MYKAFYRGCAEAEYLAPFLMNDSCPQAEYLSSVFTCTYNHISQKKQDAPTQPSFFPAIFEYICN